MPCTVKGKLLEKVCLSLAFRDICRGYCDIMVVHSQFQSSAYYDKIIWCHIPLSQVSKGVTMFCLIFRVLTKSFWQRKVCMRTLLENNWIELIKMQMCLSSALKKRDKTLEVAIGEQSLKGHILCPVMYLTGSCLVRYFRFIAVQCLLSFNV